MYPQAFVVQDDLMHCGSELGHLARDGEDPELHLVLDAVMATLQT